MARGQHRRPVWATGWSTVIRWITVARVACGLLALAGIVAFIGLGPAVTARAGEDPTTTDQITGNGSTDSAVTLTWAQGVVGADNRTVVAARDPSSPLAFMYPDFANLSVTVSQTQNLVHQSILVKWSGATATQPPFKADFLQMMQCYGDANTGPDPEDCQYGSSGLLQGSGVINNGIGTRDGNLCAAGSTPSTTSPPDTRDGSSAVVGCDPEEPGSASPAHTQPCASPCQPTTYSVPFVPVNGSDPIYGPATDFYDRFDSNEVQEANTGADGTGQQFFQTLTATEAPGLGCGQIEPNGSARGCWLVIVPRGEFEPNGWKVNGSTGSPGFINESPLGASSWAQRIQVHLGFDPLQPNCPIGSAKERGTVGTEMVSRAVFSWQLALNAQAHCQTLYGYAATPEATNTTQLADPAGAGLAFTTIPIGSEAQRNGVGGAPPDLPLVYAPIAVSAVSFGFNINQTNGVVTSSIKLTPRLVAKALTQSYRFDLTDVDSSHPGPDWAKNNPNFITTDPEFQKLNPGITTPAAGSPLAPLLTEDHSAINQQVWAWVQSDPVARAWLAGTPDENGMVVNPNYKSLGLGQAPAADSYPRADPTCFNTGAVGERDPGRCALDLLPYVNNFDDAATHIRAANNPEGASWDPTRLAPDGEVGWWSPGGVEPAGQTFMWGITDTADLAGFGLVPAQLCDAAGANCVSPDTDSVSTALAHATPDGTGLLHVNPAAAGAGAYPLVNVTYAAVRTTSDPGALKDFANFINFAVGPGQTPGVIPGELPRGYLPLPNAMRATARGAAAQLILDGLGVTPPPGPSTVVSGAPAPVPVPAPLPPGGYTTTQAKPVPAAETTPATSVGGARWALVVVVLGGLAGAASGPLLRTGLGRRPAPSGPDPSTVDKRSWRRRRRSSS